MVVQSYFDFWWILSTGCSYPSLRHICIHSGKITLRKILLWAFVFNADLDNFFVFVLFYFWLVFDRIFVAEAGLHLLTDVF